MKRPKEIQINPVLNGFIVRCGCQSVVFESRERLLAELSKYLFDPDSVEKEYLKEAINPMECDGPQVAEAPPRLNRVIEPMSPRADVRG